MSISLNANFELLSAGLYLDARQQFNTIIEMKDFAETSIPDGFITYNKETQNHYVFDSSNTVDATLGKWREYNSGGGSSEEQIKDWVSGSSYLEGDYIYHEGELYRCLASNSDVDFDESNWEQLTYGIDELSKEDVERLLGLTKEEIEAMTDLILDTEVRIDKTYSSSKIYTDIQQCLEDSKTYTLEELGKFSGVSYKIVTSTSEMTSESIIYLLANGNTYDMYVVEENGATTKIGDTNVNLSDYYTKTEMDNDFLKKADADGKYATITTVDGKIDKDKIVTVLDDTSTDEQVPSAKAVNDKFEEANVYKGKYVGDLNEIPFIKSGVVYKYDIRSDKCTNTPVNTHGILYSTYFDSDNYCLQEFHSLQTNTAGIYIRDKGSGAWSGWKKLATIDKVNGGSLGELDITDTIDINSSGTKIPNVKAIYNDIIEGKVIDQTVIDKYGTKILKYPLGIWRIDRGTIADKFSDLPVKTMCGRIEITSIDSDINKNPWNNNWGYRAYNFESHNGTNYFRKLNSEYEPSVIHDTGWQRVCTTTVDDVSKTLTPLFPSVVKVASGGVAINYIVRNGWCNVNFKFNITSSTTFSWTDIAWGLPIPANSVDTVLRSDGKATQPIPIKITSTGSVSSKVLSAISTTDWWTGNISYPVAE